MCCLWTRHPSSVTAAPPGLIDASPVPRRAVPVPPLECLCMRSGGLSPPRRQGQLLHPAQRLGETASSQHVRVHGSKVPGPAPQSHQAFSTHCETAFMGTCGAEGQAHPTARKPGQSIKPVGTWGAGQGRALVPCPPWAVHDTVRSGLWVRRCRLGTWEELPGCSAGGCPVTELQGP